MNLDDSKSAADVANESLRLPGLEEFESVNAKPFLRWAGGKTRLLNVILPFIPNKFENYFEPFLGSGAVFFAVRNRANKSSHISDLNSELINIWKIVHHRSNELLHAIKKYKGKDSEEEYYNVRATPPSNSLERAAWFFYLNQTSWNGLWRVNKWGEFNVPWGDRPFRGIESAFIDSVSSALEGASVEERDFREALEHPRAGDFVYLDPPYLPVSDTSKFSGYTERRFRADDLIELAEACKHLSERGVEWALSNRDNEMVRELFSFGQIRSFTTRRSVAAQNRRNVQPAKSPEVLIIGRPL